MIDSKSTDYYLFRIGIYVALNKNKMLVSKVSIAYLNIPHFLFLVNVIYCNQILNVSRETFYKVVIVLNTEECIAVVEGLAEVIGSGDEEAIEKATADILQVKTFLLTIDQKINDLNADVELLNKRANGLRSANNDLIRQIGSKEENEDLHEELTTVDEISAII